MSHVAFLFIYLSKGDYIYTLRRENIYIYIYKTDESPYAVFLAGHLRDDNSIVRRCAHKDINILC